MKKPIIALIFALVSLSAMAQVRGGLRLAPSLSFNSFVYKGDDIAFTTYDNYKSGAKFAIGPFVEFGISDNFAINIGAFYQTKRVGGQRIYDAPGFAQTDYSVYNLQYFQVPVTFKFYTNEIADGMKLYFFVGPTFDLKLAEKVKGDDDLGFYDYAHQLNNQTNEDGKEKNLFAPLDIGVWLGTGVEWQVGSSTALFGGFSFQRGLINILNPTLKVQDDGRGDKAVDYYTIRTSLLNLDLGVKF